MFLSYGLQFLSLGTLKNGIDVFKSWKEHLLLEKRLLDKCERTSLFLRFQILLNDWWLTDIGIAFDCLWCNLTWRQDFSFEELWLLAGKYYHGLVTKGILSGHVDLLLDILNNLVSDWRCLHCVLDVLWNKHVFSIFNEINCKLDDLIFQL